MVNWEKTLTENVADILGNQIAFRAFMENGEVSSSPVHKKSSHFDYFGWDEFTKEQLFFISLAQEGCEAYESEEAEWERSSSQVQRDNHSPNSVRVMGMLESSRKLLIVLLGQSIIRRRNVDFF
ncbi:Membrane metallo-endopeptidase-like 1 [Folsomia candida]|uniref:Membrane metallo-endopeptidase-like 1 n=1 Tax=Folsomia candida TaxID=158441 RepID=A0A226E929_FOLCA|nr:Membrane metallo-endopeptidase-like 1 [Folsomia candida]